MTDDGRLETQVVEEGTDGQIEIPEEIPEETPTVAKRATVASVKKELDALKQDVEGDVLQWLGQLDVRLEDVEKRTAAHNAALLGDVKTRLEIIEAGSLSDVANVAADIAARIDALEEASSTLTGILRSHLTDTEGQPPAAAAAAGPTMAPTQQASETTQTNDIREIAAHCQTMADVLLICRILKADPTLTDADRDEILQIATGAAGVPITQGIRIRAGVQNTRA